MYFRHVSLLLLSCAIAMRFVSITSETKSKQTPLVSSQKIKKLDSMTASNGYIKFTPSSYTKYVLRPDRPYHFIVMFTALGSQYQCAVCSQMYPEFKLLAASYQTAVKNGLRANDGLPIYFGLVDVQNCGEIFQTYQMTSAPLLALIKADFQQDAGQQLPKKATLDRNDIYDLYSRKPDAESIADFIAQKISLQIPVQRSKTLLYLTLITFLITAFIAAKFAYHNFEFVMSKIRQKKIWMLLSMIVYAISVSGMIFCIIHSAPLFGNGTNFLSKYFIPQSRAQYYYEGFIVSGLHIMSAFFTILMSEWAVRLKQPLWRGCMVSLCVMGFFVAYKTTLLAFTYKNQWYRGWLGL